MKKILLIVLIIGLLLMVGCKPDYNDLPEDQRCMAECMDDAGLTPGEDCGPGTPNGPGCEPCMNKCYLVEP